MKKMTILKEAKVSNGEDYNIEIQIGRMANKYAFGLKYQNGSSSLWRTLVPVVDHFFYKTEQEAVSKAIICLGQKTSDCLDECTIRCNHCRYTRQMHASIVEQLTQPQQLDLFGGAL